MRQRDGATAQGEQLTVREGLHTAALNAGSAWTKRRRHAEVWDSVPHGTRTRTRWAPDALPTMPCKSWTFHAGCKSPDADKMVDAQAGGEFVASSTPTRQVNQCPVVL